MKSTKKRAGGISESFKEDALQNFQNYQSKFVKETYRSFMFRPRIARWPEVVAWVEAQESASNYILSLIIKDMRSKGIDPCLYGANMKSLVEATVPSFLQKASFTDLTNDDKYAAVKLTYSTDIPASVRSLDKIIVATLQTEGAISILAVAKNSKDVTLIIRHNYANDVVAANYIASLLNISIAAAYKEDEDFIRLDHKTVFTEVTSTQYDGPIYICDVIVSQDNNGTLVLKLNSYHTIQVSECEPVNISISAKIPQIYSIPIYDKTIVAQLEEREEKIFMDARVDIKQSKKQIEAGLTSFIARYL